MIVKIGCCGFPMSRRKYYEVFNVVEVQQTFYKLPQLETVRKWREEAPSWFEFTLKAWQVLTHSPKSPTWKKAGININSDKYGLLKPTKENFKALEEFMQIARILESKVIIFQTPPSLGYSESNYKNILEFFKQATSMYSEYIFGWEPRGTWSKHLDKVENIVYSTGIIHVVDPFKVKPIINTSKRVCYFRLHGIGRGEVNYKYKYTIKDFETLFKLLVELSELVDECYVMFNNIYMRDDALDFKDFLSKNKRQGLEVR